MIHKTSHAKNGHEHYGISTTYGVVPTVNGKSVYSEDAKKVEQSHFVDKKNYRGFRKMTIEERIDLNNAIRKHPDKNHEPTQFKQNFKL